MNRPLIGFTLALTLVPGLFAQADPVASAAALLADGRTAEAKRALEATQKSQPNNPEVHYWLGRVALREDDADQAAKHLEKAIALAPKKAEYHFRLGTAYGDIALDANPFRQASLAKKVQAEFEKAVELDPTLLDARHGLISFYLMAPGIMGGSDDKALAQATAIRKLDPLEGHRAFARIHRDQKKTDLVEKEYRAAVKEFPADARSHYWLVMFLAREKKYPDAFAAVDAGFKAVGAEAPLVSFALGYAASESGAQLTRGAEGLERYLQYRPTENEPQKVSALYYLGIVYEKQGRKDLALKSFRQAQGIAPKSKEIAAAVKRVS